nr:hypothetical protein [Chloroflexota bacterium]
MKKDAGLFALAAASVAAYALAARGAGFPLDDAWIHQVYARNLALHGQWAFVLGQPSAGSTSPLWTVLLAAGYALRLDYYVWTIGLNALLLGAVAWLVYRVSGVWWAGALAAVEWHLVWAAASGMETVLFCALVMAAWYATIAGATRSRAILGGALIGLAVWTRPDGLTLLPFVAAAAWRIGDSWGHRLKRLGRLAGGAGAVILPYFPFNFVLSHQFWPNTFFAKQAEYAVLRALPLWQRLAEVFAAPWVGALLVLAPGVWLAVKGGRKGGHEGRRYGWMAGWAAAFLLAYALRLPVTYQHGRYLMPVIPALVVVGAAGMAGWVRLSDPQTWRRVLSRAWVLGAGGVAVGFWALGAGALAADVRVVNSEMVSTAKWVAANVPPGAVVAAHDIGALGYFADVRLVDLAGLVSPEVIPLLGDDGRLWQFVRAGRAAYVITFPGWCPAFTRDPALRPVFQTGPLCDPAHPNLHMTVYQLDMGR